MKYTGVKFVAIATELMNTLSFTSSTQVPHSDRVLTNRCQKVPSGIPAHRVYRFSVSLQQPPQKILMSKVHVDIPKSTGHYTQLRQYPGG
jgi:hypothetical protein